MNSSSDTVDSALEWAEGQTLHHKSSKSETVVQELVREVKRLRSELGAANRIYEMMDRNAAENVREIDALRRDLRLAVAHDRQPYPTAEAYEKACAVLDRLRSELALALAVVVAAKECQRVCAEGGPEADGHGHVELLEALNAFDAGRKP